MTITVLVALNTISRRGFIQDPTEPVAYELNIAIEPAQGSLSARAKLRIPPGYPERTYFNFWLHETFALHKLSINGQGVEYSSVPGGRPPFNPASKKIIVNLPPDVSTDGFSMEVEYDGRLKNLPEFNSGPGQIPGQNQWLDDQVNSRMVELANYSSWYPQFEIGQPLRIEMELSLPQGWIPVCSGEKVTEMAKEGRAVSRWFSPADNDIVILASPDYKRMPIRQSGFFIEIYHTRMPDEFLEREVTQIGKTIELFAGRLGKSNIPGGTVKHIYSPKRKGQGGAGFARPGMIVTSEGLTLESLAENRRFSLFQGIAHEIAHFWWNFGSGQGDWINESFAEYFSAVALEIISAKEEFESALKMYRRKVGDLPADAPSLSIVPFLNDRIGYIVRYYKGALMLDDLRCLLGDDAFFKTCRDFYQEYGKKSIGTPEFRSFWKNRLGHRGRGIDIWLDSKGDCRGSIDSPGPR